MTAFRSGKSGSLTRRAKAAGQAIGKRRRRGGTGHSLAPPAVFNLPPPPSILLSQNACKETSSTPRRIMAQESAPPPLNPEPIRPRSETAEMMMEYRIFKGAGLLSEWRKRWAWYLPEPA